jgi:putative ABC transport system permease protein
MADFRFWRWRQREDEELDRELEVHLALEVEDQLETGLPLRDAQLAARRAFGNVALTKEELRDMRTGAALERLWQETRHTARRLRRSPAFALATALTLALAIGANAAIFAVVYRVVLNPLPYGASDRLVTLEFSIPSRNVPKIYYIPSRLYFQYLERTHTLDGLALYVAASEITLTGQGNPERIRVARTTSSLASVLRVTPAIGRWLNENDMAPGASPAAVLSHGLWVRRFGQDPNIIGQPIPLDGVPTVVVGVMPASFAFPDPRIDVWVPAPYVTRTAWPSSEGGSSRSAASRGSSRLGVSGSPSASRARPTLCGVWPPITCSRRSFVTRSPFRSSSPNASVPNRLMVWWAVGFVALVLAWAVRSFERRAL